MHIKSTLVHMVSFLLLIESLQNPQIRNHNVAIAMATDSIIMVDPGSPYNITIMSAQSMV